VVKHLLGMYRAQVPSPFATKNMHMYILKIKYLNCMGMVYTWFHEIACVETRWEAFFLDSIMGFNCSVMASSCLCVCECIYTFGHG
jgi:hypothetical protein